MVDIRVASACDRRRADRYVAKGHEPTAEELAAVGRSMIRIHFDA